MTERQVRPAGLALVKQFEGLRLQAYRDPAGVWTVGYGHTTAAGAPKVTPGMTVTEAEAEAVLRRDLATFEARVARLVSVALNDNEFAALVSLCFNIGATAFAGSTCLRRLNAGDRKGAAEALTRWTKATVAGRKVRLAGLVRRRQAERRLFLAPPSRPGDVVEEIAALPPAATRSSWLASRSVAGTAAALTGALGAVTQALAEIERSGGGLFDILQRFPTGVGSVALILAGLGLVAYARRDDWLKGRR
ncbi:MAG: hypothetical protein Kilf2KO_49170 [Rhodospirillales bacterium]